MIIGLAPSPCLCHWNIEWCGVHAPPEAKEMHETLGERGLHEAPLRAIDKAIESCGCPKCHEWECVCLLPHGDLTPEQAERYMREPIRARITLSDFDKSIGYKG